MRRRFVIDTSDPDDPDAPSRFHVRRAPGAPPPTRNFTVAYCVYRQEQRRFDPVGHGRFFARWLGPAVFPDRQLVLRAAYAVPAFLPPAAAGATRTPEEELDLLGLGPDVDVRVCRFGSTEILRALRDRLGDRVAEYRVPFAEAQARLRARGVHSLDHLDPDKGGFSHNRRLFWPHRMYVTRGVPGKAKAPFVVRFNDEPWFENVDGVGGAVDGKLESVASRSVTLYEPLIVTSFSWRWSKRFKYSGVPPGDNFWSARVGGSLDRLEDSCTRPPSFDAAAALARKGLAVASVNSHCSGPGAYLVSTVIRELFAVAIHEVAKLPVNHLGMCPLDRADRTTRVGLTNAQIHALRERFAGKSAVDIFSAHKFAIAFENSKTLGYATEKVISPYQGHAVPLYFGSDPDEDLWRVINRDAVLYCDIPRNVSVDALRRTKDDTKRATYAEFRRRVEDAVMPHLRACARRVDAVDRDDDAWKRIVAQNLCPTDPRTGELAGVWSPADLGAGVRDAILGLGFESE